MLQLSVAEQRYQAVLAGIEDGLSVIETAAKVGVSRQTLHAWLTRYAEAGLEGLADRLRYRLEHEGVDPVPSRAAVGRAWSGSVWSARAVEASRSGPTGGGSRPGRWRRGRWT